MLRNTIRTCGLALFLSASVFSAATLVATTTPANAAAITNRAVGVPLGEAQALQRQGQLTQAIAKAKEARGAEGVTPREVALIDELIAAWLLQAKDYRGAMAAYESLADRGINRERSLQAALDSAMQLGNMAKVTELAGKMPGGAGNAELFIAQGAFTAGRHQEAITRARPFTQRTPPNQQALQIIAASCFAIKDEACRRNALEQLVINYPSPERWRDLLRLARNQRGLTDEQQLEIFRIRELIGDMKTQDDYLEMGQIALIAMYPGDAKSALDKGIAAKILNPMPGDRVTRLMNLVNEGVAADMRALPQLQAAAQADATGNADVKLGLKHLSFGKYAEAQTAIQNGVTEAKLTDPDAARIGLGRALLGQNKKAEAIRAFAAVPRASKHFPIARLWWIYAQRA